MLDRSHVLITQVTYCVAVALCSRRVTRLSSVQSTINNSIPDLSASESRVARRKLGRSKSTLRLRKPVAVDCIRGSGRSGSSKKMIYN